MGAARTISGGVVAHNEERTIRAAVRSLLDQELPTGVAWSWVWVVASGCTDRTVAMAEMLASEDPRVRVIVEPDRGGKSRALAKIFAHATGDALVLLNADARAEPGAVRALLRRAEGKTQPYAVMARPAVPSESTGRWSATLRWMWNLHHEFHTEILVDGDGAHLSDELLLVSLREVPWIPTGVINDGSFLAVWLRLHAGGSWYAPEARVSIQVPSTVRDHLSQRRRIHVGNAQVAGLLGTPPSTLPRRFLESPGSTLSVLRRALANTRDATHLARLFVWEIAAHLLAVWDRVPPRRDHVLWQRIESAGSAPPGSPAAPDPDRTASETERRVVSLLRVAGEFGTGVALDRLHELLPRDGPGTVDELQSWLEDRPGIARLERRWAYAPAARALPAPDRTERAVDYRRFAEHLWGNPLAFTAKLVRCVGISGSVAYGEPAPGDDLDLFVVARTGSLWWLLVRTHLALRLARLRTPAALAPAICLNYALEDRAALLEFGHRRDLLFAREALSVDVIRGNAYYSGLLAAAAWMRAELPRRFDARCTAPGGIAPERAPWPVRVLNPVAYLLFASYLQLQGLRRNHRSARRGLSPAEFRTVTDLGRLAFPSARFEKLRSHYADPMESATQHGLRGGATSARAAR